MSKLRIFLSVIRAEHTVFALPFALTSAIITQRWLNEVFYNSQYSLTESLPLFASSPSLQSLWENIFCSIPGGPGVFPSLWDITFLIVAMVSGRTVAMLANRLIDAQIDAKNPRTANWHIPSGLVKSKEVQLWLLVSSIVFSVSALALNLWSFLLAPVAILYLILYPYAKRFTFLCHYILGGAQALAPLGVFLAITGTLSWQIFPFAVAVGLWVASFDIYYSLQDYDFDKSEGIFSIPVGVGKPTAKIFALAGHMASSLFFLASVVIFKMGLLFFFGTLMFTITLLIEFLIVWRREDAVGFAFFTLNGFISLAYLFVAVFDILSLYMP